MRRYRVNVDNEPVSGVDVDIHVTMNDFTDISVLEAAISEATRRILASARSDVASTIPDSLD